MAFKRRENLTIQDAEIGYSDFKASRYGSSFMLIMNKGDITYKGVSGYKDFDQLIKDGWPIQRSNRDEDELVMWVNVKFDVPEGMAPPIVYTVTGKRKEKLDADTIGILDSADISKLDVSISPAMRKDGNGYTAYVKTLFATLYEDPLMAEYGMYESEEGQEPVDDDIPF